MEVENYLAACGAFGLWLARGVAIDHRVGQDGDELQRFVTHVSGSLVVPGKLFRCFEAGCKTITLGGVLGDCDGLTVSLQQARYISLLAFDYLSGGIAARIHFAFTIA